VKFRKIVESCIYYSDLETMKNFYVNKIGLEFISEEKGRHVFGKNMLLIFNPKNTRIEAYSWCNNSSCMYSSCFRDSMTMKIQKIC